MKNGIVLILIGVVIGVGCTKALDQQANASNIFDLEAVVKEGGRIGFMFYNLKEGSDMEGFENYLKTEYIPNWNQVWAKIGAKSFAIKSVTSNENKDKLGAIVVFPDNERHAELFPGEPSDVVVKTLEALETSFMPIK